MADISKVTLPNNETYDLKDSVARGGIGNAKLFYGTCSSAAAATEKAVTCSEFTANDLVAGTMINVKFDATNSGAIASLAMNVNGTGAKRIKYIYNNSLNDIPAAGYLLANNVYTFRYDGTNWVVQLMYNTNTSTGYGYYDYYFRPCAGTSAIYRYKIVGMGEDNRLYPIVTTNQADATQVAKAVQTMGIKPGHLWIYYSTSTVSAGGAIAAATLLAGGGANTVGAYSFNESIPTYRTIYLRGTYNKEKDLFYLYDDGASPCKSYYTFVPTNSAVTLSDYFAEGNYYMIVGGSYSTANYFSIFADNPLYYFDGTNLIPVSTKVAKDEITSMVGTDEQEDNDPYSFRKTANGKISGFPVAAYDEIVGGSVVWNQQNRNRTSDSYSISGVTFAKQADGSWIANGTATADTTIPLYGETPTYKDHKYFIFGEGSERSYLYMFTKITGSNRQYALPQILSASNDYLDSYFRPRVVANAEYTNHKIRFGVIDLTAAVTPTIADYIYSLEQTTAGAGVAWFKKYFPGIYYGYCEPHFEHVQTSAKCTVGFNQWDEEWELGSISSGTGVPASSNTSFRTKNFIPVLPDTRYYIHYAGGYGDSSTGSRLFLRLYDDAYNYVGNPTSIISAAYTMPSNVAYVKFVITNETTYKNDICISFFDTTKNGEYEPYRKKTYPIEPKVLRGVPKLDSANRLYFDGDVMKHDGSGEYRYGLVDLGTLPWGYVETYNCFYAAITPAPKSNFNAQCTKYPFVGYYGNLADKTCAYIYYDRIAVRDSSYTDVASFKTAMSGVYLLYELNAPEPFMAEPYQYPMSCDSYGTEEFMDYGIEQGTRDIAIPVGHNTKYRSGIYGEIGFKADISYVNTAIGGINSFDVEVVQALPTSNIKDHTIYFIRKTGSTNDVYDEYMYINSAWEHIGSTDIDLSGYVPTTRTINSKALSSNITLSASDVGAAKAESVVSSTLTVASWSNGVYSFTSTYPNASYDIAIEPDGNTITDEQYQAWCEANIVGSSVGNVIKALGTVPTVAIPVVIRVMPK